MLEEYAVYTKDDYSAIEILNDFLPDKIFDAHAHLFDTSFLPMSGMPENARCIADVDAFKKAMSPMLCNPKVLNLNAITWPDESMADLSSGNCQKSDIFLIDQLNKNPDIVGEIMVLPFETAESIEKRLIHPNIVGLKCYFTMSSKKPVSDLPPQEYLPESAWEVADKYNLCITLHLSRSKSLSDSENFQYICTMAERYPNATLILAHAARGFASWTTVDIVEKLSTYDNVWFDFSAICESPALFRIMQKIGVSRCLWGSDYPNSTMFRGKAISIGNTFHWMFKSDFDNVENKPPEFWLYGIENLMAVRQACILADLSSSQIEDLFYNNAVKLFKKL